MTRSQAVLASEVGLEGRLCQNIHGALFVVATFVSPFTAFFASSSALSFPCTPLCPRIQCIVSLISG